MTRLSPQIKLSGKTETSEVSGIAQFNFNRFRGEQGLDSDGRTLSLVASRSSERNTWSLRAWNSKDSTTESELLATGIVQNRTQRTVTGLNPSWSRALTERSSLNLGYQYQDVKYDTHINLNDYVYQQANAAWQYRLGERDQLNVSASASTVDYDAMSSDFFFLSDSVVNKTKTRTLQAGLSHQFSETLQGALSLGRRHTDSVATHTCSGFTGFIFPVAGVPCTGRFIFPGITFTEEAASNNFFVNASAEQRFDSGRMSITTSRDVTPSGNGVVEIDRITALYNKSLSEKLNFNLDAAVYKTSYLNISGGDRRYALIEPKLNWRLTEWWSLDAGYRYARSTSDGGAATSNQTVYVNLAYSWPKMAFSR